MDALRLRPVLLQLARAARRQRAHVHALALLRCVPVLRHVELARVGFMLQRSRRVQADVEQLLRVFSAEQLDAARQRDEPVCGVLVPTPIGDSAEAIDSCVLPRDLSVARSEQG